MSVPESESNFLFAIRPDMYLTPPQSPIHQDANFSFVTSPNILYPTPPQSPIHEDENLETAFHEALLLSVLLEKARVERMERDATNASDALPTDIAAFRAFFTSLTYLCDYEKNGNSVTSLIVEQLSSDAHEQTSNGLVYHIATNLDTCSKKENHFSENSSPS